MHKICCTKNRSWTCISGTYVKDYSPLFISRDLRQGPKSTSSLVCILINLHFRISPVVLVLRGLRSCTGKLPQRMLCICVHIYTQYVPTQCTYTCIDRFNAEKATADVQQYQFSISVETVCHSQLPPTLSAISRFLSRLLCVIKGFLPRWSAWFCFLPRFS